MPSYTRKDGKYWQKSILYYEQKRWREMEETRQKCEKWEGKGTVSVSKAESTPEISIGCRLGLTESEETSRKHVIEKFNSAPAFALLSETSFWKKLHAISEIVMKDTPSCMLHIMRNAIDPGNF